MPLLDNAHALVVGISRYQHLTRLPTVQDAEAVAAALSDPDLGGYPKDHVRLLLEEQATQAALRDGLAELGRRAVADSSVLLYFSGHGGHVESGPHAGQYLLPVNTVYPDDADLARTAVAGAEVTAALNAVPARKVLVVFDCCHAGGIGQPRNLAAAVVKPGLADDYYEALKAGRGRAILASSRSTEFSWVEHGASYGLFTQHLLDGLRGGAASEDGFVRVFDLFEYLQPRVTAARREQHPVFKAELEDNFPVALYRGGQKGLVAKDDLGFRYDAYVSYVDRERDSAWVWDLLVPRLEKAGLRVAVSGDVQEPGVERVVGVERGIRQSKRTIVVLSRAYLADHAAAFENVLGQTMSIQEGTYRLLPVKIESLEDGRVPTRLSMLVTLDLCHPRRAERDFSRLVTALQGPLPKRW